MSTKNPMSKALIRRETIAGYAFMAPSLIFFLGFVIYPMVQCVITSFFDSTMNREDIFIGTVSGFRFYRGAVEYRNYCNRVGSGYMYFFSLGKLCYL